MYLVYCNSRLQYRYGFYYPILFSVLPKTRVKLYNDKIFVTGIYLACMAGAALVVAIGVDSMKR